MLKKEKAIFYLIVGICAAALVILAVVGLVLQSQPTVTVSLPSSLEHSSSALESSRVSELAQPASSASSQAQGGVEGITLSAYEISLTVGETQMPLVTMTPEDAPDKSEIWASSDGNVATVDGMGRITGVGVGSCTTTSGTRMPCPPAWKSRFPPEPPLRPLLLPLFLFRSLPLPFPPRR